MTIDLMTNGFGNGHLGLSFCSYSDQFGRELNGHFGSATAILIENNGHFDDSLKLFSKPFPLIHRRYIRKQFPIHI